MPIGSNNQEPAKPINVSETSIAQVAPSEENTLPATADQTPITPVAGLGVDIIEIERMEQALRRTPRMATRMFTAEEQEYAQSKSRPHVHFALFFAAKEAVLKALGTGFAGMRDFTDVEVGHDRFGKPIPHLHGLAKEIATRQGIVDMQLSLSYTRSVGVASAVAIKEQDRPQNEEKLDQKAELAKKFKELRSMLDEMEAEELQSTETAATGAEATETTATGAEAATGAEVATNTEAATSNANG